MHSEKPSYETLPAVSIGFAKGLEELTCALIEKSPIDEALKPFHNSEAVSLAGGPIVLLPQTPVFHEHDVLTHLDVAAWNAAHWDTVILPVLDDSVQEGVRRMLCDTDTLPFVTAAQLHDIEKAFFVNLSVTDVPYSKAGKGKKLNLLAGVSHFDGTEEEAQAKLQTFFLEGGEAIPGFDALAGYFGLNGVDVNMTKIILSVYSWIDQQYIEESAHGWGGDIEFSSAFKAFLDARYIDNKTALLGIFTMICDNLAQGDPPQKTPYFDTQIRAHIQRCVYLVAQLVAKE